MGLKYTKIIFCLSVWANLAGAANIPLVGLDKDGAPVEVVVPKEKYTTDLRKAVFALETTALPILQKKQEKKSPWMMRSAVFGLGVNPEVGIGELKFGFLPRFRIGFSNAKEPSMP